MDGFVEAQSEGSATPCNDECLSVMAVLRQSLVQLDAMGADVAAAHLEACLNELGKIFISDQNPSNCD